MLPAGSFLDQLVDRFRHRWETDRQYRAAASGVVGLVVLIALCSCAGIVSSVTSRVLASGGFGSNTSGGPLNSSGAPAIQGAALFPTETIAAWQPGQVPNGPPIPNSGTPIPTPTHPPTPTAAPSPTQGPGGGGGGGGGQLPTTCNGTTQGVSWALYPCPQVAGQGGTMTVSAPGHGGQSINVILSFVCNSCSFVWDGTTHFLDSSGGISFTYTVPSGARNLKTPVSGEININNNQVSFSYLAAPCQ